MQKLNNLKKSFTDIQLGLWNANLVRLKGEGAAGNIDHTIPQMSNHKLAIEYMIVSGTGTLEIKAGGDTVLEVDIEGTQEFCMKTPLILKGEEENNKIEFTREANYDGDLYVNAYLTIYI